MLTQHQQAHQYATTYFPRWQHITDVMNAWFKTYFSAKYGESVHFDEAEDHILYPPTRMEEVSFIKGSFPISFDIACNRPATLNIGFDKRYLFQAAESLHIPIEEEADDESISAYLDEIQADPDHPILLEARQLFQADIMDFSSVFGDFLRAARDSGEFLRIQFECDDAVEIPVLTVWTLPRTSPRFAELTNLERIAEDCYDAWQIEDARQKGHKMGKEHRVIGALHRVVNKIRYMNIPNPMEGSQHRITVLRRRGLDPWNYPAPMDIFSF